MDSKKAPKQLNSPLVAKAMKFSSKAVVWVYRRTGGRIGGNWRVGAAFKKPVPTLLLEHAAASPASSSSHPWCT
jgi:F420H(2)-dependent quinone reductase